MVPLPHHSPTHSVGDPLITAPRPLAQQLQPWLPEIGLGAAVAFIGLFEASTMLVYGDESRVPFVLIALAMAVAAACFRKAPGASLGLLWVVALLQVSANPQIMLVEVVVVPLVAFGTARWGRAATIWLSALSIPFAALVVVLFFGADVPNLLADRISYGSLLGAGYPLGLRVRLVAALLGMTLLGLPWLAGLAVRYGARARASEVSQVAAQEDASRAVRESEQAREIAQLREQQARMARDVHDAVGHSLAVILAQAESAQYRDADDTEAMKQTMATIATAARSSLQEVRDVLASTGGQPAVPRPGGLDRLVDGVRASGHRIDSVEIGVPQVLPPELDEVAFRVLQEMLTNAVRHGRRDEPVQLERHWEGELRLEVRNVVGDATPDPGQGLAGMRRRLESVGGRLDVRRRDEAAGPTFTVTAWIPLVARE